MLRLLKRKLRKWVYYTSGQGAHLRASLKIPKVWYGNEYGGFYVCPDFLDHAAIVYSFGVGEDISFDSDVIKHHGCQVFGFDPTPRVAEWISKQKVPKEFLFCNFGIGDTCGYLDFFLPRNEAFVSGSFVPQRNVNQQNSVRVEMKTFAMIVKEFGHSKIDVLKMDIEGIEYEVLRGILASAVPIKQLLVEFHDRFFEDGIEKTKQAIELLNHHGFQLFGVSDSLEELSFVNVHV